MYFLVIRWQPAIVTAFAGTRLAPHGVGIPCNSWGWRHGWDVDSCTSALPHYPPRLASLPGCKVEFSFGLFELGSTAIVSSSSSAELEILSSIEARASVARALVEPLRRSTVSHHHHPQWKIGQESQRYLTLTLTMTLTPSSYGRARGDLSSI
ncbi:hypothetical protein Patl1_16121 [Pistacia atlantica]|uniref:Uncharacterized protein n=1 Tax=Pistacia atlantica TaxID=434234 RepID=A0ACC1B6P3_9ROSI|nr:hypothetical protein Patl1_16121 [Pistacia atlantica]